MVFLTFPKEEMSTSNIISSSFILEMVEATLEEAYISIDDLN